MTKDQIKTINTGIEYPQALGEWEWQFVNDLAEVDTPEEYQLSPRQASALDRIADKLEAMTANT